jgi:hypothetical protein
VVTRHWSNPNQPPRKIAALEAINVNSVVSVLPGVLYLDDVPLSVEEQKI